MKTFFIVSDTHSNLAPLFKLESIMSEADYVIHLGDHDSDMQSFKRTLCDKLYTVKGNCDGGNDEKVLEVDGYKILITHGHKYGVKSTLLQLALRAKELGVNAVFYGHTHIPEITSVDGVTFINPGSVYSSASYCYAVLSNGKLIPKIVRLYR